MGLICAATEITEMPGQDSNVSYGCMYIDVKRINNIEA